jgi:hypothetical protein
MLRKVRLSSIRTEILMAVVAVVTLLAIWLVPGQKETPPTLPQLTNTPATKAAIPLPPRATETSTPATKVDIAPPTPAAQTATPARDGDRARAIFAGMRRGGGEPDPVEIYASAQRLQDEGHLEDAYLLFRYAANHGNAQAALVLGSQADPAYHTADGSFLPEAEPEQAIKWYRMAGAEGNEEAVSRLQALHGQLQQAAAAGDAQARRLLLQW